MFEIWDRHRLDVSMHKQHLHTYLPTGTLVDAGWIGRYIDGCCCWVVFVSFLGFKFYGLSFAKFCPQTFGPHFGARSFIFLST